LQCPGEKSEKVLDSDTDCNTCKCIPNTPTTCPVVDCTSECKGGTPIFKEDINGCPSCSCEYKCPPVDKQKCEDLCSKSGKKSNIISLGLSGCEECSCTPKCVECQCAKFQDVTVNLVNYVTKRNYVPYDVYYDAKCNADMEIYTNTTTSYVSNQYTYVVVIRRYVSIYRRTLILLRNSLSKMVGSGQISKQVFEKSDLNARQKMAQLEQDVLRGSLTIQDLQKRSKQVTELIKSLGYDRHGPSVCLYISGKRLCNLHPNYVQTEESSYLKTGLFSKTIYTKVSTSITNLKRRDATTVQYTRHASTFRKNHIKVHGDVRKTVWSRVLSSMLINNKSVLLQVQKSLKDVNLSDDNLTSFEKLTKQQRRVVKKVVLRQFKRSAVKKIREEMRTPAIKALQQQHKAKVDKVYVYPTRVTKEIVRLPAEVIKQKDEEIVKLLAGRPTVAQSL